MMSDMTLQQVVNHQSLNFHLPCNVQVGEHNIQNQLTKQLKEDVEKMKNEIQQLQLDKLSQAEEIQSQAVEIQQLESRVKVMEDKTRDKKTDENINKKKDDVIILTVKRLGGDISVSRHKTVRELNQIIEEEYRRKCGRDCVCYIYSIYGIKLMKDIYNINNNNEDLPLSHYGVDDGDRVYWLHW